MQIKKILRIFLLLFIIEKSCWTFCEESSKLDLNYIAKSFLYAPLRAYYFLKNKNLCKTNDKDLSDKKCFFCSDFQENKDEKTLILKRFNYCYVILNQFPYTNGHLLVVPIEHEDTLEKFSKECRNEILEVTSICCLVLKECLKAQGFNVGINIGKVGGASVPSHLHLHILPRWDSDTGFINTISNLSIISLNLETMYKILKSSFDKLKI